MTYIGTVFIVDIKPTKTSPRLSRDPSFAKGGPFNSEFKIIFGKHSTDKAFNKK